MKRALEGDFLLEPLVYCCMELFEDFTFDLTTLKTMDWSKLAANDPTDAGLLFFLSVYRFLTTGLGTRSVALFKKCVQRFFDKINDVRSSIFLLSLMWNQPAASDWLKTVSLKMAAVHLKESNVSVSWAVELKSFVVPQLVSSLTNASQPVRRAALGVFNTLGASMTNRLVANSFMKLIETINQSNEELLVDVDQLRTVLANHLRLRTSSAVSAALFNCLVSDGLPDSVQLGLCTALAEVNSPSHLTFLLPVINSMIETGDREEIADLGVSRSRILALHLERFTADSASVLSNAEGWNTFHKVDFKIYFWLFHFSRPVEANVASKLEIFRLQALHTSKAFMESSEGSQLSPQDIVIEVVTRDFFRSLPSAKIKHQVFEEIVTVVVTTDKTVTARQGRRALKRITLDADLTVKHLDFKRGTAEAAVIQYETKRLNLPISALTISMAMFRTRLQRT